MSSKRKAKVFERSMDGIVDAILSEMEDLREGHSTPHEAIAFAQLGDRAIHALDCKAQHEAKDKELAHRIYMEKRNPPLIEYDESNEETVEGEIIQ